MDGKLAGPSVLKNNDATQSDCSRQILLPILFNIFIKSLGDDIKCKPLSVGRLPQSGSSC